MKVSDYVVSYLVNNGVRNAFSVTGGAAMHLNDSAGSNPNLEVTYMHNEQSCAMAAEGYARVKRSPALVIVTAGPGAINSFNGVFGAFRVLIFLPSGIVKSSMILVMVLLLMVDPVELSRTKRED